ATLIHDGLPRRWMSDTPGLAGDALTQLIQFLRTLQPRARDTPAAASAAVSAVAGATVKFELTDGRVLDGTPLMHGVADDVQLRTADGRIALLRKSGGKYRRVTSEVDWASHDGSNTGNRYSPLAQINKTTVARLAPKWIYTLQNTTRLEVTPVVAGGVMYIT